MATRLREESMFNPNNVNNISNHFQEDSDSQLPENNETNYRITFINNEQCIVHFNHTK